MKKHHKKLHHVRHAGTRSRSNEQYLVVVRSWMLVVVFALMLGVGAIVGTFLNAKLNESVPSVAGASIETR